MSFNSKPFCAPEAFVVTEGSELDSLLGNYTGIASNVSSEADALTGIFALECNSVTCYTSILWLCTLQRPSE